MKKSKKKKSKKAKIIVEEMDAKAKKKAAFAKKKGVAFPDEPPLKDTDEDAAKPMGDDNNDEMDIGLAAVADDDDVVDDKATVLSSDVKMGDDAVDEKIEEGDATKMSTAKQVLPTENKGSGAAIAYGGDYDSEEEEEDAEQAMRAKLIAEWEPDSQLPLDDFDKTMPFYFLDAQEDIGSPGTVFLFGKVPIHRNPKTNILDPSKGTISSCAVVNNMQRCVFVVPKLSLRRNPWMITMNSKR